MYYIQTFLFLVSLLLFYCSFSTALKREDSQVVLQAIILSEDNQRYNHSYNVLSKIGFNITRHIPIHYTSNELDQRLSDYMKTTKSTYKSYLKHFFNNKDEDNINITSILSNIKDRKLLSNRLAYFDMLENIQNSTLTTTTTNNNNKEKGSTSKCSTSHIPRELDWVFLFEDDIQLHPSYNTTNTHHVIRTIITGIIYTYHINNSIILYIITYYHNILYIGMKMATNGMLYLGICGPKWLNKPVTVGNNEYREAYGYCTHAIG